MPISQVSGLDEDGYDFTRTTHTAINAIEPGVPVVEMPIVHKGFFNQDAVINCTVNSLVPFTVQWLKNGEPVGNVLHFRCLGSPHYCGMLGLKM